MQSDFFLGASAGLVAGLFIAFPYDHEYKLGKAYEQGVLELSEDGETVCLVKPDPVGGEPQRLCTETNPETSPEVVP